MRIHERKVTDADVGFRCSSEYRALNRVRAFVDDGAGQPPALEEGGCRPRSTELDGQLRHHELRESRWVRERRCRIVCQPREGAAERQTLRARVDEVELQGNLEAGLRRGTGW